MSIKEGLRTVDARTEQALVANVLEDARKRAIAERLSTEEARMADEAAYAAIYDGVAADGSINPAGNSIFSKLIQNRDPRFGKGEPEVVANVTDFKDGYMEEFTALTGEHGDGTYTLSQAKLIMDKRLEYDDKAAALSLQIQRKSGASPEEADAVANARYNKLLERDKQLILEQGVYDADQLAKAVSGVEFVKPDGGILKTPTKKTAPKITIQPDSKLEVTGASSDIRIEDTTPKFEVGNRVRAEIPKYFTEDSPLMTVQGRITEVKVDDGKNAYSLDAEDGAIYPTVYEDEIKELLEDIETDSQESSEPSLGDLVLDEIPPLTTDADEGTPEPEPWGPVPTSSDIDSVVVDVPEFPLPGGGDGSVLDAEVDKKESGKKPGIFTRMKRYLGFAATTAAVAETDDTSRDESNRSANRKNGLIVGGGILGLAALFTAIGIGLNNNSDEPKKDSTSVSGTQTPGVSESVSPSVSTSESATSDAASASPSSSASGSPSASATGEATGTSESARVEFTAPVIPEEYSEGGESIFGTTQQEMKKIIAKNNLKTS